MVQKVEVMATTLRVLFMQMIGRGLRGPRNGGTESCLLIDYRDSLDELKNIEELRRSFRDGFLLDSSVE